MQRSILPRHGIVAAKALNFHDLCVTGGCECDVCHMGAKGALFPRNGNHLPFAIDEIGRKDGLVGAHEFNGCIFAKSE